MIYSSFTLLGAVSIFLVPNVLAVSCTVNGISTNCPEFCCDDYCCNFNEYTNKNSGLPTGMIEVLVVICVIILTFACCCCYIARRRAEKLALLGLQTEPITVVPNAPYPHQVHPPPVPIAYNQPLSNEPPPPYEVTPPPYPAQQPYLNPYYRSEERKY